VIKSFVKINALFGTLEHLYFSRKTSKKNKYKFVWGMSVFLSMHAERKGRKCLPESLRDYHVHSL